MSHGHSTKSKRKPPKKPKEGRPTLYSPEEHPRTARKLTAEGKTKQDVAELLGIARSTLDEWRQNHPEFSVAFELGKEDSTDKVERSLLERAVGYSHPAQKVVVVDGVIHKVGITEHYPPEVSAIKYVLGNRRPKEWSDKTTVELNGLEGLVQRLANARRRANIALPAPGISQEPPRDDV